MKLYSADERVQYTVGIDPGQNGGLVALADNCAIFESMVLPKEDDLELIAKWCQRNAVEVWLEDVQPDHGWGLKGAWTFGQHIGMLKTIFRNCDLRLINPRTWQAAVWRKDVIGSSKDKSLETAMHIWSKMDWRATERSRIPHDGIVDAALIAYYGVNHGMVSK